MGHTCLRPGTSPTAVPSDRSQIISGAGFPLTVHSNVAPVLFEKSILLGGSLMKVGPTVSSSPRACDPVSIRINAESAEARKTISLMQN